MPAPVVRHAGDIVRVGVGGVVLAASAYIASHGSLSDLERHAFSAVNKLPDALSPPLTVAMQAGALAAVAVAAAIALVARRPRLAAALGASGVVTWLLVKVLKELIDRERPARLVADTIVRGDAAGGLGFPSGHAAVAAALATTLTPYLPRWARRAVWSLVVLVGVARMFVGAHLPVDVIGGLALGWVVGAAVNLAIGTPGWKPDFGGVARAVPRPRDAGRVDRAARRRRPRIGAVHRAHRGRQRGVHEDGEQRGARRRRAVQGVSIPRLPKTRRRRAVSQREAGGRARGVVVPARGARRGHDPGARGGRPGIGDGRGARGAAGRRALARQRRSRRDLRCDPCHAVGRGRQAAQSAHRSS